MNYSIVTDEQEEIKAKAVQDELKGLDVKYLRHYQDGLTPNMARVNGHSIVWHQYAYADPGEMTVEVYFKDADDVEGHVPIKGLRKRVET